MPESANLRSGLIVDVGANRGDWTAAVLDICPGARVVAVEPSPALLEPLKQRFGPFPNVQVIGCAAAERSGRATFYLTEHDHGSSLHIPRPSMESRYESGWGLRGSIEVETMPLDELLGEERVALLKLDVQGAEGAVLRGAPQTLSRTDFILIEVTMMSHYQGDTTFPGLHLQLVEEGFEIIGLSEPYRDVNGAVLWLDACYRRTT